jgi:hypothetical protein
VLLRKRLFSRSVREEELRPLEHLDKAVAVCLGSLYIRVLRPERLSASLYIYVKKKKRCIKLYGGSIKGCNKLY